MNKQVISEAIASLQKGGVIAYPTEAVYGLGCDPFDEQATLALLALKRRSVSKGVILIAAAWSQVSHLVQALPDTVLQQAQDTWPGPVTWVFPASTAAPSWICGARASVAIRLTAHPIARELCEYFGKPLVSTSANVEGQPPAKSAVEVKTIFADKLNVIVEGNLGNLAKPTEIRDILTGNILRAG